MTNSVFRAVAPVSAVCAAFRTQPSAYPPNTRKPDVAPTCGSVWQSYSTEAGAPAGGFRRRRSRKRRSSRLWICQEIKMQKR